jgi:hypothetical protein
VENNAQLVVRLPKSLLDRLDVYAQTLQKQQPGSTWKRADVARMLLTRALDDVEPAKPKRRK